MHPDRKYLLIPIYHYNAFFGGFCCCFVVLKVSWGVGWGGLHVDSTSGSEEKPGNPEG